MAYGHLINKDRESVKKFVDQKLAVMDQSKVGLTNIIQHFICVRDDAIPWRQESYESNLEVKRVLYHKIDSLIDKGYIRKGNNNSEWLSPARMIKNKDGNWIFHVDYTKLNSYLLRWPYTIHSQWDILQRLRNARIISTIRIKEAFHQIELKPDSNQYTAFDIQGRGVYEWVRMPYGLTGASTTLCRVADRIKEYTFKRINSVYCNIRGDDKIFVCLETWIVVSETSEQHKVLLDCLLDVLYENGLEIDIEKSQFAKGKIDYFGFTIDYDGLHVSQDSITPIIDYPQPKNIPEVRQFNSMVHRYRNHLKDIAIVQGPLNKFCATEAVWKWTELEEESFQKTKEALLTANSLSMLNPNLPFRLYTYVTHSGHGAELVQYEQRTGCEYLITYISKIFNEAEKTYPAIEKQVLSIISALSQVEDIIAKCECDVITDYSVLLWYGSHEKVSRRLDRWIIALFKYNITLKSYAGKNNDMVFCSAIRVCDNEKSELMNTTEKQ